MQVSNNREHKPKAYSNPPKTKSRLTKNLLETNRQLQAIFDASPVAIFALNLEGKVTMWSTAAERIFGWRAEEVLGRFNPLTPVGNRDEFWKSFSRVLHGKGYLRQKVARLTKAGTLLNVSVSAAPLRR